MENKIVGKDMICPVTNQHCDDECCMPGSECNLSGNSITPRFAMYYFTESKWYGPLRGSTIIGLSTLSEELHEWVVASLPSGDSKIPEFAGMVKEEGKDFEFEIHWNRNKGRSMPTHADLDKIAVPLEEEQTAVPVAEEFNFIEERRKRIEERRKRIRQKAVDRVHKMMNKLDEENAEEGKKYKVIADYPGSVYSVGTIVSDPPNATGWAEWAMDYPHLFEPVQEGVNANAEEGKQTFSEEDIWNNVIKRAANINIMDRPEIAHAALKRAYANIETAGTFCSTWIDGYCQALRDFNIGT